MPQRTVMRASLCTAALSLVGYSLSVSVSFLSQLRGGKVLFCFYIPVAVQLRGKSGAGTQDMNLPTHRN